MFEALKDELKLLGYSEKTIKIYLYYNHNFLNFIKKEPKYITSSDIKKYLIHNLNKKPRTINLIISALKFYYDRIYHKKLFYSIKRMKEDKTIPVVISKENIKKMINKTKNLKHKILIELIYGSGLRKGESINLKINDLNLQEGYGLVKGKGKKDRYIILSEKLINHLRTYQRKDNNPYIFNTSKGHYSPSTAEKIIKNAAKRAGIKDRIFPHALRSSFTTHLIDKGIDIVKIQSLLGHSKIDTTRNYIKISTKDLKEIPSPLDLL